MVVALCRKGHVAAGRSNTANNCNPDGVADARADAFNVSAPVYREQPGAKAAVPPSMWVTIMDVTAFRERVNK